MGERHWPVSVARAVGSLAGPGGPASTTRLTTTAASPVSDSTITTAAASRSMRQRVKLLRSAWAGSCPCLGDDSEARPRRSDAARLDRYDTQEAETFERRERGRGMILNQGERVNTATDHGCFGCGDRNPIGLKLRFQREADGVAATF